MLTDNVTSGNLTKKMANTTSETQDFLQDNLEILEKYHPRIHSAITENLSSFSISFSDSDKSALSISDNTKQITISTDQRKAALSRIAEPKTKEPVYLVIGLGAGDELQKLFETTRNPNDKLPGYKLPIYVLEPEPLMLITTLWLHNLREIIESSRVHWFIGENATTELVQHFKSNRQEMCPSQFISNWYPESHPAVKASIENLYAVAHQTKAEIYTLKRKINKHYDKITGDEWHHIFTSKKRPLRIMGCTSRFTTYLQYCIRDLLAGFEELGHETHMYMEKSDVSRLTQLDMMATIDEFQPDVIINIDHFRDEYPYLPSNVPFVNWIQDLLPSILNPDNLKLHPYDFTCVFGEKWLDVFKNNDFYKDHDVFFLPLGINTDIYKPIPDCEKTFDVLYVSHILDPSYTFEPFKITTQELKLTDDETVLLDNKVINYEQLIQIYTLINKKIGSLLIDDLYVYSYDKQQTIKFFEDILNIANIEMTPPLLKHFNGPTRLTNEINYRVKIQPIKALKEAGLTIRVYGKNWKKIPAFSDISYGPIENGNPLNKLMNQAKICLNNSPGTSFHMRALEILGSGSFMISRRIEHDVCDITSIFPEYSDVVLFNNEIDVVSLSKYYILNDSKRQHIATSGYKHAIKKFCYSNISNSILTRIRENI